MPFDEELNRFENQDFRDQIERISAQNCALHSVAIRPIRRLATQGLLFAEAPGLCEGGKWRQSGATGPVVNDD